MSNLCVKIRVSFFSRTRNLLNFFAETFVSTNRRDLAIFLVSRRTLIFIFFFLFTIFRVCKNNERLLYETLFQLAHAE